MSRHLSVATVIEKNKISSATAFLILIEIDITDPNTRQVAETIRFCRNTDDIMFNGHLFTAANFNVDVTHRAGEESSIQLTAQDPLQMISSRLEYYAGGMNSPVRMIVVNSERLDSPPEMLETFAITSASTEEQNYAVNITLGSENPLSIRFPLHQQFRDRCCWRFKSKQCGYVGAETVCDYTLEGAQGCRMKANTLSFGGIPGLRVMNI